MRPLLSSKIVALGEAMIELAPQGDGLYRRGFAGDTFNTAWHLAQLLGDRAQVGFASRIGQDSLSDSFADQMQADGIDRSGLTRDPVRRMGLYLIELDGVERSFHYWRDQSAARLLADDPVILAQTFGGAGLIYLSGITLAILTPASRETLFAAIKAARKTGALVAFDPNIRPRLWRSVPEMRDCVCTMLGLTDIALPSFDDEARDWGDATPSDTLNRIEVAGVPEIVVKDGAGPVQFRIQGASGTIATPAVAGICDTTGAGDAFNAGYLAARVRGADTATAIGLGQRMAGVVLCHFGARATKAATLDVARHLD